MHAAFHKAQPDVLTEPHFLAALGHGGKFIVRAGNPSQQLLPVELLSLRADILANQLEVMLAQQFRFFIPHHGASGGIDERKPAVRTGGINNVGGLRHERAVPCLAFPQGLFRALPGGNIDLDSGHTDRRPLLVAFDYPSAIQNPCPLVCLGADAHLGFKFGSLPRETGLQILTRPKTDRPDECPPYRTRHGAPVPARRIPATVPNAH